MYLVMYFLERACLNLCSVVIDLFDVEMIDSILDGEHSCLAGGPACPVP